MTYSFNDKDLPKIILQLLLHSTAKQMAAMEVLCKRFGIRDEEYNAMLKEIDSFEPALYEELARNLYTLYGKTPEI